MSKLITAEQLNTIHRLQRTALNRGDHATYWSLSLAITFALDCGGVDVELNRIDASQRSRP